jgi:pimeloyl-ACP methyl ester carboxylesterase
MRMKRSQTASRRGLRGRRISWPVLAAGVLLAGGGSATALSTTTSAGSGAPRAHSASGDRALGPLVSHEAKAGATGGLARFTHQRIAWHACRTVPGDVDGPRINKAGGKCGEVRVPLDYRRPGGRTITLEIARIPASDPAHRHGVLFTNPGGPGVPGLGEALIASVVPDIGKHYDAIGIDPRFVGQSTPLHCDWRTDTFLRSAGPNRHTFDQSVAFARRLAAGCVRGNENLLPYATTRNTARDMDLVRAVLGAPKISYFGGSYGSYLAAVYLQMFGERADRFVIDSSPDPDVFGPNGFAQAGQAAATALDQWAAWAARHNAKYGLGATAGDVLATVNRLSRAAERRPLRIGKFAVDTHTLPYLLFLMVAEDDEDSRASIADAVRTMRNAAGGATVTPSPAFAQLLTGLFTGSGAATDRAGTPILCGDRPVSHDPDTYFRNIQAHRAGEPLFGPFVYNITPCAFWPVRSPEPPTTIHNNAPVLMVAATGDPFTPYPGQLALHRDLAGSRLVTLEGAFRHGATYLNGSACVDGAVNRYLIDGDLPAADRICTA